jgi:drug/metabolite transporter (DMT)-like permease
MQDAAEVRKGKIYLWLSIFILAAASPIVAKLVQIGEGSLIDGRNPISFCNLLFAGNLVAALTLLVIYHREWKPSRLKMLTAKQWLVQFVLAIASGAIAPALMFLAIERTSVTNIVLLETVEIPLGLFLAWLLYREKSSRWAVLGAGLALLGVIATLLLQSDMPKEMMKQGNMREGIGRGEIYAIIGTLLFVLGSEIGRKQLQSIPLGVFSVFRNLIGSIIFFTIAYRLFGPEHFMDIFEPVLWKWMLFYGGIVVVCGQLCWFSGIKRVSPGDISLASAFSPVAGVLFAFLILSEIPMKAQIIGGVIILCGIGAGLFGDLRATHKTEEPMFLAKSENKQKAFTGV